MGVRINLRTKQIKSQVDDATYQAVRQVWREGILPEAKRLSPREPLLRKGRTVHNADSIRVTVRRVKQGIKARIFTTSGHGYYLEKGTKKMAARPYMYPAFVKYSKLLAGNIKEKFKVTKAK